MNITRAVILGVGGGALAAWLASAATSGPRPIAPPAHPRAAAMEKTGAELAAEISRLHDRLHPNAAPVDPSRNLFNFAAAHAAHAVVAPAPARAGGIEAPAVAVEPPIALLGIADDNGVRTAILSNAGQVLLVKEGERAGDRYTVVHIAATVVELADASASPGTGTLRLALK